MSTIPSNSNPLHPPKLWNANQFGAFQRHFSAHEQHQLLNDDAAAQCRVSGILASLIAIGTVLAILSVAFIAFA